MKQASAELIALLEDSNQFVVTDLLTITLLGGEVLRYTNWDHDLEYDGNTWDHDGPEFQRSNTRTEVGVIVATMDLALLASADKLIDGQTFTAFARAGGFDGATVRVDQAFLSEPAAARPTVWGVVGTLNAFVGKFGEIDVSRVKVSAKVNSPVEILNVRMPRNVYGTGCLHTLYDSGCTLAKANFSVNGETANGSNSSVIVSNLSFANGAFDLGTIRFTSGDNDQVMRTIKQFIAPGTFILSYPLPSSPAVGDDFTAALGCDKQQNTCGINSSISFTANTTTNVMTANAHGLANGTATTLSTTGNLPAPLTTAGRYFVISANTNNFQLSNTINGAAIDITTAGDGTNRVAQRGKFANLLNFRGFPYVPIPETMGLP